MNVLHIANKPIFPILDGGQLATHRMLTNLLHLGFNVKSWCIETPKHPFDENAYPEKLRDITFPESHFINTTVTAGDVFKSLFSSESYNAKRFYDKKFEEKLKDLLQTNTYRYIVLESAYLLHYTDVIRMYSDAKIILRAHNVEYRIWRQAARKEKSFFKRLYFKKLASNLKRFELDNINKVDAVFCISEQDKEFFRRRGVRVPMTLIPVYMDIDNRHYVNYENNDYFFMGSMSWKPNADAVKWILSQIAPRMAKMLPDSKIHIAGSAMPKKWKDYRVKNVVFHGKVDDIHQFMSEHGTLIVPLKTGSGVRIKILEALSSAIPVISTEKGKEGIDLIPKKHFLTANIAEEFVLQMKYLNENTELKRSLGEEGQKFICQEYSLESTSAKIREFISKI